MIDTLTRPLVAFGVAAILAGSAWAQEDAGKPNIIFLFSDDHATEAISAYSGGRLNHTPGIDRLAVEGMRFNRSFCANSICGPSRASILTGKHSHKNGFLDNENARFDGSQVTFPKLLRESGYTTSLIGKWHLVSDPTGFDYWEILPGQGSYYNPDFIQMDGSKKRRMGYCSDLITDRAIDWLENGRDPDKPFVLMCQHKAPHRNWAPPARHLTLFDDRDLPVPETLFDDYANRSKWLAESKMSIANDMFWGHDMKFHGESPFPEHFQKGIANGEYSRMTPAQQALWDAAYGPKNAKLVAAMEAGEMSEEEIVTWKYQRYIKDYLRTVQAMDDAIGRLLDYLDAHNLVENTVVIYSSDQGFYLGEHGWYDKRWMFEESLEMPFLIRWPGVVKPGGQSDTMIQNIDYAPIFLDIAGLEKPEEMQGRSFLPTLRQNGATPEDWREAIYYAYYGERTHNVARHDGVRTQRYKLMFFPQNGEWQLFDLREDPREMRSVHDDPAYAEAREQLTKKYHELRDRYEVNTATIPVSRTGEEWWRERWQAKNKETREGPGKLLFIGDSITQGWEGSGSEIWNDYYGQREAVNLGFSGDRTEHVLWRLKHGDYAGVDPELAVVMIGTNNTGHSQQPAEETAAGVEAILERLIERFPEVEVLLLGVFPRGATPEDPLRRLNDSINERIAMLHDGERVHYLDIGRAFLDEEGRLPEEIMPDLLHLSKEGYARWAAAMEEKLASLGDFEQGAP